MCDLMMSHINSTKRPSVNGSPYDFMALAYGSEVLDSLKIKKIDSKDVKLYPKLLTNIWFNLSYKYNSQNKVINLIKL